MEKKVLFILEDVERITYSIKDALKKILKERYEEILLIECNNIPDADYYYEEYKSQIACLVCDSNMISKGLSPKLKEKSFNGLYSGWLWFEDKFNEGDKTLPNKTIFYTAYYDDLSNFIKASENYHQFLNKICIIQKRSFKDVKNDELINKIMKLLMS